MEWQNANEQCDDIRKELLKGAQKKDTACGRVKRCDDAVSCSPQWLLKRETGGGINEKVGSTYILLLLPTRI